MRKHSRAKFLPVVLLPALMPALMLPALRNANVSDLVLGGMTGASIGLAIIALGWMVWDKRSLSGPQR